MKRAALLVGIGKFRERIPPLDLVRADVEGLAQTLRAVNPDFRVEVLLDEQATKDAILHQVKAIRSTLTDQDLFLLYFASHGFRQGNESYLVAHDSRIPDIRGEDSEALATSIRLGEIFGFLEGLYASVFITDACHPDSPLDGNFAFPVEPPRNIVGMMSSQPDEESHELRDLGHGLYTYYLLEGLKGAADPERRGVITVFRLHDYVSRKVQDFAKSQLGLPQTPVLMFRGSDDVALTTYPESPELAHAAKNREEAERLVEEMGQLFDVEAWAKVLDLWDEVLRLDPDGKGLTTALEARRRLDAELTPPFQRPRAGEGVVPPLVWPCVRERSAITPGAVVASRHCYKGDLLIEFKNTRGVVTVSRLLLARTNALPARDEAGMIRYHILSQPLIALSSPMNLDRLRNREAVSRMVESLGADPYWSEDLKTLGLWEDLRTAILVRAPGDVQSLLDAELEPLRLGPLDPSSPAALEAARHLFKTFEQLIPHLPKNRQGTTSGILKAVANDFERSVEEARDPPPSGSASSGPAAGRLDGTGDDQPLAAADETASPDPREREPERSVKVLEAATTAVGPGTSKPVVAPDPEAGAAETSEGRSHRRPRRPASDRPAAAGEDASPAPVVVIAETDRLDPPTALTIEVGHKTTTLRHDGRVYSSPTAIDRPAILDAAEVNNRRCGELLFRGIIRDEASQAGTDSLTTAQGYYAAVRSTGRKLDIGLSLDVNDPGLYDLPWELLCDPGSGGGFLALEDGFTLHRDILAEGAESIAERPLRFVVAICNPPSLGEPGNRLLKDLAKIDVAHERAAISEALDRLGGVAHVEVLDGSDGRRVTVGRIKDAMKDGCHVLHIVAHGVFTDADEPYHLVMGSEDGAGRPHAFVPIDTLEGLVQDRLSLVVLSCCRGAVDRTGRALVSLADRLVRKGVPAVVAMRALMPMEASRLFNLHVYDQLIRTGRMDRAVTAGRAALYLREGSESPSWAIPVLLMSRCDGRLIATLEEDETPAPLPRPVRMTSAAPPRRPRPRLPAGGAALAPAPPQGGPGPAARTNDIATAEEQDRERIGRLITLPVAIDPGRLREAVEAACDLRLGPSIYGQVAAALNLGKHLVLMGPPGTGKTSLAQEVARFAIASGFASGLTQTTATADWTTFDTVGGYVPSASGPLRFRVGSFLRAIARGHWLIIDEINRAEIDKAFGELFTTLSGQRVDLPYEVDGRPVHIHPCAGRDPAAWVPDGLGRDWDYVVHPNWRILATMNAFDRSYLSSLSFALIRRFAFIDLGVPDRDDYRRLVQGWINGQGGAPPAETQPILDRLLAILEPGRPLMARRPLGPAIARDMVAHVLERRRGGITAAEGLGEAFLLHAVHQLDGLDVEGIQAIARQIATLFDGPALTAIIDRLQVLYPYVTFRAAPEDGEGP